MEEKKPRIHCQNTYISSYPEVTVTGNAPKSNDLPSVGDTLLLGHHLRKERKNSG